MLSQDEKKYLQENKSMITSELLETLRQTSEGKHEALEILDLQKDDECYYLDAYGSRISFNGDRQVKKSFTQLPLAPIHLSEIDRCSKDLKYFKDNYVQIKTPHGVDFPDLREYQNRFLSEINGDSDSIVALFPRQSGKSITTAIYLCWQFLFNYNINIGICANKAGTAREFLLNVKNIFTALPIWLQIGLKIWNKSSVAGENNVRILTDATNSDSFRGFTCALVVVDECAYIPTLRWNGFVDGIMPSQSSLAWKKNILLSTANGMNHFFNIVKGARKRKQLFDIPKSELDSITEPILEQEETDTGTFNVTIDAPSNGYQLVEVNWREVPRYDSKGNQKDPEKFKAEVIEKYGIVYFNQCYANEFIGSSYTLISAGTLSALEPTESIRLVDDKLKLYYAPVKGHRYIVAVDPAKDGIDGFAVQVVDATSFPFVQVASCSLDIDYLLMPEFLVSWCEFFNHAFLIIENNEGAGQSIADIIKQDYEYDNMYYDKSNTGRKRYAGFRTTPKSRKLILDTLKLFLENGQLQISDAKTLEQLYTFILVNGKYQADEGCHDDLVMSLAVAFAPFCNVKNFTEIKKLIKALYTKDSEADTDFTDFLTIGSFDDFVDPQTLSSFNEF